MTNRFGDALEVTVNVRGPKDDVSHCRRRTKGAAKRRTSKQGETKIICNNSNKLWFLVRVIQGNER